ncbi:MAG: HAMP domain-containing sensor histidine kinase [Candidatus Thermoplasmatota archaeon]
MAVEAIAFVEHFALAFVGVVLVVQSIRLLQSRSVLGRLPVVAALVAGIAACAQLPFVWVGGETQELAHEAAEAVFGMGVAISVLTSGIALFLHNARMASRVEALERVHQARTQFMSAVAHELNNPITPLVLQLHMLREGTLGPVSEAQGKALATMDRSLKRLTALVHDFLEAARLEAQRFKLERAPLDLADEITAAMEEARPAAVEAGLILRIDGTRALRVEADPHRLAQILANLLGNAVKFTPRGGIIEATWQMEDGHAIVRVRDSGVGLRPDQIERLFQPFSQVHDTTTQTKGGTGLGLFISRGIVEAHGGRMWCESTGPGHGCTFCFTLPLAAPPAADVARATTGTNAAR